MGHFPQQIGILGGTFDPPHLGHLNLAIAMMESHELEEVWLCPAWASPFKQERDSTPAQHRLAMTQLAAEGVPRLRVIDWECCRPEVSYTVDTLRHLAALEAAAPHPRRLRLILGSDTAQFIGSWREPDEVVRLAPPLVGCRAGFPFRPSSNASPAVISALARGETIVPMMDISSTEIRSRLAAKRYCGHLLPVKVVDYIYNHHLYF